MSSPEAVATSPASTGRPAVLGGAQPPDAEATTLPGTPRPDSKALPALDLWPRTYRVLPWLIAGFVVMLWLIPFDAVQLPVALPVDAKLDRFMLLVIFVVWLIARAGSGDFARSRRSAVDFGVLCLFGVALLSVVVNASVIVSLYEFPAAVKNLALLVSYITFFYIVASVLRPQELPTFIKLMVVLATIMAIGSIYEFRTDANLFYEWTAQLPGVSVAADQSGRDAFGRRTVNGPTQHGLASAVMLSMMLPFALVGVMSVSDRRRQLLYAVAITLILAGAIATSRKSSVVAPVAACLCLVAYRPRAMLELLPLGLIVVALIHALAPGAMGGIRNQLMPGNFNQSGSVAGRREDYAAVAPDVARRPIIGRGYGTYDPKKYRFIDNQWLLMRIQTGWLGVAAYATLLLLSGWLAHAAIRGKDALLSPPALGAAAGIVTFAVSNYLFDALAFPQVPYLFFFLAAIAVIAGTSGEQGQLRNRQMVPA